MDHRVKPWFHHLWCISWVLFNADIVSWFVEIDECSSNPCYNGGTCTVSERFMCHIADPSSMQDAWYLRSFLWSSSQFGFSVAPLSSVKARIWRLRIQNSSRSLVTETNELFPPCTLNFRANHYLKQIITFCLHENGTFTYIMCQFSFRSLGSYRRLQLFVPRRIQREAVLPRLCARRVQKWWHVR